MADQSCPSCLELLEGSPEVRSDSPINYPSSATVSHAADEIRDSLCGVRGWLKLWVVMDLYVHPVIFFLNQTYLRDLNLRLLGSGPGAFLVNIICAVVGLFLIVRGMQVAIALRDVRPRAVQKAKQLLKLWFAWALVSTPMLSLLQLNGNIVFLSLVLGVLMSTVRFAIWFSYFNVSKRVQATYPDWRD